MASGSSQLDPVRGSSHQVGLNQGAHKLITSLQCFWNGVDTWTWCQLEGAYCHVSMGRRSTHIWGNHSNVIIGLSFNLFWYYILLSIF